MRVLIGLLFLLSVATPTAQAFDWVVDGREPGGGDCGQLGGFWDGSGNPGICEVLVYFNQAGDSVSVDHAVLRLTYIAVNQSVTYIGPDGSVDVVNSFGLTNRGQWTNHGQILSPDGVFNEAGALIYNSGSIDGGLSNDGVVVNVCPGSIDPPAGPNPALEVVTVRLDADSLIWCDNGASYDVVRGDLEILHSTGGDFRPATLECLAEDIASTSIGVADPRRPGAMP